MLKKFLTNQVKMGLKNSALITVENVHIKLDKSEKEKVSDHLLACKKSKFSKCRFF